jgi:hypothetical protein
MNHSNSGNNNLKNQTHRNALKLGRNLAKQSQEFGQKMGQPWQEDFGALNMRNLDKLSLGTGHIKELGGKLVHIVSNFYTWIIFIILLFFAIIFA